jgi:hypothetical protein
MTLTTKSLVDGDGEFHVWTHTFSQIQSYDQVDSGRFNQLIFVGYGVNDMKYNGPVFATHDLEVYHF